MNAIVLLKPGIQTNLLSESRLLKAALLFSNQISIPSSELEALIQVYKLDESKSVEFQYGVVLKALPVLNPDASVEQMHQSLAQVKKLKNNKKRSSREIVALKKSQKQLKQINTTFKIVTETLFQASQFDQLTTLIGHQIFLTNLNTDYTADYLPIVSNYLLDNYEIKKLKTTNYLLTEAPENTILSIPLFAADDFDQFAISDLANARNEFENLFLRLLSKVKESLVSSSQKWIDTELEELSEKMAAYSFKIEGKEKQEQTKVILNLGFCKTELFENFLQFSDVKYLPDSNKEPYKFFLFLESETTIKSEEVEQPVQVTADTAKENYV